MGTIIYKPHCARCGATINEEVIYRKHETRIAKNFLYSGGFIEIEPNRCENCGEVFETIEIPIPKEGEGEVLYGSEDTISRKNCPIKHISSEDMYIPYLMHKEMDIPISECQKAYNIAVEYLRNKSKLKG